MIAAFQHIILCVTTAAVFLAALMAFVPGGAIREIVRLAGGLMLILALVTPLRNLRITGLIRSISDAHPFSSEQVEHKAEEWNQTYITEQIEQYISQKAETMGINCTVSIFSERAGERIALTGAEISYRAEVGEAEQRKMEELMRNECGITNIRHRMPGRAESGSS